MTLRKSLWGGLASLVLMSAIVALQQKWHFDPHRAWDLNTLPGFDAHVYVAMAEEPRVFTVAPWGYRLLEPLIVSALFKKALIVRGFERVALSSLVLAGVAFFFYLRALGISTLVSLLGVAFLGIAPPTGVVFENPFLVEPLALLFWILSLWSIEARAHWTLVGAYLLALSLTKEIWPLGALIILLDTRTAWTARFSRAALTLIFPVVVWGALRGAWSVAPASHETINVDLQAAFLQLLGGAPTWLAEFLLGGISVAALFAVAASSARSFASRYALALVLLFALPLAASVYSGDSAAANFFSEDIRRLMIYPLPVLIAMALHGLQAILDRRASNLAVSSSKEASSGSPNAVRLVAPIAGTVVFVATLLGVASLDRYQRIDLGVTRDGPYVLGFARESLKTARKLARGERVVLSPKDRQFAWGVSPPQDLGKLRFFLRDGFGVRAHYGIHDIRMKEPRATLVVPSARGSSLQLTLSLDAEATGWMEVLRRNVKLGEVLIGPRAVTSTFSVPKTEIVRGDIEIDLRCPDVAHVSPRLLEIALQQEDK